MKANKYLFIISFIFFINPFLKSNTIQEQLRIVDKQDFFFLGESESLSSISSVIYYYDNLLYFAPGDQSIPENDMNLYVFSYSIQDKKVDSILVKFPEEHLFYNMWIPESIKQENNIDVDFYPIPFGIQNFAISDNFLIVGGKDRFLVYEKQSNTFEYRYAILSKDIYGEEKERDPLCFPNIKIVGDILLGYRCTTSDAGSFGGFSSFVNDAADSQLVSTAVMKYNLKEQKLINFRMIYPEPKGFGFLNFTPRQNMDCNGEYYIISDITEYNLYLYNTD